MKAYWQLSSVLSMIILAGCGENPDIKSAVADVKKIAEFKFESAGAIWSQDFVSSGDCKFSSALKMDKILDEPTLKSAMFNRVDESTSVLFDARKLDANRVTVTEQGDGFQLLIKGKVGSPLSATVTHKMLELEHGFCKENFGVDSERCESSETTQVVALAVELRESGKTAEEAVGTFKNLIEICQN